MTRRETTTYDSILGNDVLALIATIEAARASKAAKNLPWPRPRALAIRTARATEDIAAQVGEIEVAAAALSGEA